MSTIMDEETGELVVLNDLTGLEFNVYANIGPSYDSSREETFEKLHGAVVGTFDLTGPNEQYTRALGALENRVKSIEEGELQARQQREDRKPRCRP